MEAKIVRVFRHDLLAWFRRHRRALPWRTRRTPYRVWISELMLQQTRVEQARDYFLRFMKRFPNLKALAAASQQDVLKLWEGLGYYSRARRAHQTAQWLIEKCNGKFPRTFEGLLALPGIGPYTAAAVGSLAFNLDVAVVDGNVARVLCRVFAFDGDPRGGAGKKKLQAWVDELLPHGRAGAFNESLMELGALCCTPRKPDCPKCPLLKTCQAYAEGRPENFPTKTAKKKLPHKIVGAGVIVNRHGEFLIAQRHEHEMLGGLWEFPGGKQEPGETMEQCIARELREELGIHVRVGPCLTVVHHAYSHFTIALHAHWCRIERGRPRNFQCLENAWVPFSKLWKKPFSRADLHIITALRGVKPPKF
ncbi:MAG: A/G-specific adenine glycosylase [Verrucomicrobia bacterium]|nr:MAG: A/G-specific adenine glycosylase [Verrucomicrobiota bacterium]